MVQLDQWTTNMIERLTRAEEERNQLMKKQNELLANIVSKLKEQRTGSVVNFDGMELDEPF